MVAPRVTSGVPSRPRLLLSVLMGLAVGWKAYTIAIRQPAPSDFTQVWYAARALLAGRNPYYVIGPGLEYPFHFPFFYPLSAAVAVVPLAPFSDAVARAVFMAISGTCFSWALMAHGYAPLIGMLSAATIVAVELVQWSPIMAAGVVLAPLGVLIAAKPTIGAAVFFARPSWWAVGGAVVLSAIAFLIQPGWPNDWFVNVAHAKHFSAPLLSPGGVLALLALLRWRRPEARLLVAMVCVPQSMILYEAVPLCLVPRGVRESVAFLALTYAAQIALVLSRDDLIAGGRWLVWLLYLPATIMVLRRPNEGRAPGWLDRLAASWPAWLRGAPSA
jgi:hypothetical protein